MFDDSTDEQWKAVPGFDGYEVSNMGRARCLKPRNRNAHPPKIPRILKSGTRTNGYPYVGFSNGSKASARTMMLHIAVMRAFVGPPPPGCEVAHYDGNKANACLGNLRYATHLENEADKARHGTKQIAKPKPGRARGERCHGSKLNSGVVAEIRASSDTNKAIAVKYGVDASTVSNIRSGKTWKHVA